MASPAQNFGPNDGRQLGTSPRPRGREWMKSVPCRNVTTHGFCRNEKDGEKPTDQTFALSDVDTRHEGCMYNHDVNRFRNNASTPDSPLSRKTLNVESQPFTPTPSAITFTPSLSAKKTLSPKTASANTFVPRNLRQALHASDLRISPNLSHLSSPETMFLRHQDENFVSDLYPPIAHPVHPPPPRHFSNRSAEWPPSEILEFVPQNFNSQQLPENQAPQNLNDQFNPYAESTLYNSLEATPPTQTLGLYNPEASNATSAPYYQQGAHIAPLQHHLYAPLPPNRDHLLAYQRTAHEFFLPENLRQDLQRKADATLQVLPNSTLPPTIEHFHALVPLDTNSQKSTQTYGYKTWAYKAISSKDGYPYVLRRIEGFRLNSEKVIQPVQIWKRINNASVVKVHDCFTTRAFGDSSLVLVTDYHPLAKTLAEHHFAHSGTTKGRGYGAYVPEQILWSYIVQLASALKAIHSNGLAARLIGPNKVMLTSKNRVRLNGCGVMDITQTDTPKTMEQMQQEDLQQLGRLILALASNTSNLSPSAKGLDSLSRAYSEHLKECISNLIERPMVIDIFLAEIATQSANVLDSSLHEEDSLKSELSRELENGRLVRLITKLGFVNERPEYNNNTEKQQWSETGERYYLKLFRDYVFHQVGQDGRPVIDLGHVISCLNKLDAGSEEKVALVSRDEQFVFVVSYKEMKRGLENAFQELVKVQRR